MNIKEESASLDQDKVKLSWHPWCTFTIRIQNNYHCKLEYRIRSIRRACPNRRAPWCWLLNSTKKITKIGCNILVLKVKSSICGSDRLLSTCFWLKLYEFTSYHGKSLLLYSPHFLPNSEPSRNLKKSNNVQQQHLPYNCCPKSHWILLYSFWETFVHIIWKSKVPKSKFLLKFDLPLGSAEWSNFKN